MLDFRRFAAKHHIALKDTRPGWVSTQCPICGPHGSHGGWYLGWNENSGAFNCWRCGKLQFWPILGKLLRLDEIRTRAAVAEFLTNRLHPLRLPKPRLKRLPLPTDTGPMLPAHKAYLRGRNFNPEKLAAEWGLLGSGPLGGLWAWRVIIPVQNSTGRVIAYQGRAIGNRTPKYKMTDDAKCLENPKTILYGIDKAKGDSVMVVEGGTGAWRLGPGTVATMGIDWKSYAVTLRMFKNRYILFDCGPEEQKAAVRAQQLAETLSLFPGNTEIISGFSTDPGAFSPAKARRIRRKLGFAN